MSVLVDSLKNEAKDPVFDAVAHVFAVRKRSRDRLTTLALYNRMKKEGYKFEPSKYGQVLRTLSRLGIGTLEMTRKGDVRGLKDIPMTLQSIGEASITGSEPKPPKPVSALPKAQRGRPAKIKSETLINVSVMINGKSVIIPIPKEMTGAEVAELVKRLQDK